MQYNGNITYYTGLFISPWNMLEIWLMSQLNEGSNDSIFQQDGSPAHYKDVRGYLNRNLPQRWIERTGKEDGALMRWPPRSPDFTPWEFFFWGFVKDTVFVPPLLANHRFSQPYHRCCGSGQPWYAYTSVERDGLSHRCLPYYQRWTHWASVKYVKKSWRVSLSIGVKTTTIRWVVYLLRILTMFHGLINNLVL